MSWLVAIDTVLKTPLARWGMVLLVGVLLGYSLNLWFTLNSTNKTLSNTKLQLADSMLMTATQTLGIQKAHQEHLTASAKLQNAVTRSKTIQKELLEKQARLLELELTGTCEEMVEQIIEEVRR